MPLLKYHSQTDNTNYSLRRKTKSVVPKLSGQSYDYDYDYLAMLVFIIRKRLGNSIIILSYRFLLFFLFLFDDHDER